MRRGLFLAIAAAFLFGFSTEALVAQEEGPSAYRKWLYAAIGAAVVGIPSALSEDVPLELGGCNESSCFAPLAAATGGVIGFLIGYERDQNAARHWVAGPVAELDVAFSLDLPLQPERLVPTGGGALVIGDRGMVRIESETATPYLGVRGIQDALVMAERSAIFASTTAEVYAFTLGSPDLQGRRVSNSGASALVGWDGSLYAAGAGTLRRLAVEGRAAEVDLFEEDQTVVGSATRAMIHDGDRILWSAVSSRLEGRDVSTLDERVSLPLSSPVFRIAVGPGILVGAAGRNGALVVDVADPANAEVVGRYEGVNYVHDVAVSGRRAYIAAGEQGLVILDLTDPSQPLVEAVVRNLGSVHAVVRLEDGVYVLDREERRLQRISPGG